MRLKRKEYAVRRAQVEKNTFGSGEDLRVTKPWTAMVRVHVGDGVGGGRAVGEAVAMETGKATEIRDKLKRWRGT